MKSKTFISNTILIILMFFLNSCSNGPSIDNIDYKKEFDDGKSSFLKKKYASAQEKFNKVVIGDLHTDIGDDALFYLAESLFLQKEYLLAIEEYDKLIRRMQFSPYIENARYRICESYVLLSPKYFHEQTFTEKALLKLQEYIEFAAVI